MRSMSPLATAVVALATSTPALAQSPAAAPGVPAAPSSAHAVSPDTPGTFLFSDRRFHDDPEVFWPGFVRGLRGFEDFYEPVGNPIYFESPFNTSGLRALYLFHRFAEGSALQGGDLSVYALQARLALTERLSFIATKDGYSVLDADALPSDEGWNALAAGLKYTFFADREAGMVAAAGIRYQFDSGEAKVFQDGVGEFSPFISFAKGWDRVHLVACLTDRIPDDDNDGNNVLQWDVHLDWEIAPDVLKGFAPMIEVHGLHYLSDGDRTPLSVGGADYTNLGSTDVSGSTVVWIGGGFRWKFTPNFSLGAVYEYPLTNRNADIFGDRITIDFHIDW